MNNKRKIATANQLFLEERIVPIEASECEKDNIFESLISANFDCMIENNIIDRRSPNDNKSYSKSGESSPVRGEIIHSVRLTEQRNSEGKNVRGFVYVCDFFR